MQYAGHSRFPVWQADSGSHHERRPDEVVVLQGGHLQKQRRLM